LYPLTGDVLAVQLRVTLCSEEIPVPVSDSVAVESEALLTTVIVADAVVADVGA
jgi:hypothetical protein